ncbi:MAG: dipeptide epimerase [Clostridiales bacterium]|jgi:L-alanine-DL-glutamate epimerase-like enolase superfamily enzyme|nr:dipeptide epimerase [Clostridiales bacterium]
MKITDIESKIFEIQLKEPVRTAIGQISVGNTVIVKISTDSGICGLGEGAPTPFVTGDTAKSIQIAITTLKEHLIGMDTLAIEAIHQRMNDCLAYNTSAKAAIDIALHDICAKNAGLPLYRYLGGTNGHVVTDKTIGIGTPEKMAEDAVKAVEQGFEFIKVKTGLSLEDDLLAIELIRKAVGPKIHIKVDANQGWSVKQAIEAIERMRSYDVSFVEQPVSVHDEDGLKQVKESVTLPIMADESCFSPYDALRLIKHRAIDMINIKLMKSGGLFPAIQMANIAEVAGIPCMIGCMMESAIGIAAAVALAAARSNIMYADLDGLLFTKKHPDIRSTIGPIGAEYQLSEESGIGVHVNY